MGFWAFGVCIGPLRCRRTSYSVSYSYSNETRAVPLDSADRVISRKPSGPFDEVVANQRREILVGPIAVGGMGGVPVLCISLCIQPEPILVHGT